MWETLTDLLWVNLNPTSEVLPLIQWHQAYLLIKLQHPEGLACPPQLLERSLAAHNAGLARRSPPTHLERVLAEAVRQLAPGQRIKVEYVVPDPDGQGGLRVDVGLPGLKLAVEADGPQHFFRNVEPPQQDGSTKARDRLLRGWGWHVVAVPAFAWDRLLAQGDSREVGVAGLRQYLVEHTDFMQYTRPT